ncbi:MAG: FHA domain-containing protein [Gammaproteobacteria bacterium]|jgi:pSer/pThr/pTyr-binding forkhead associated (FHA) protein|nr:FHA domain-containing protein [Gammaproteobacteria bacterium]NIN60936.1 FHA domain-containing protein [Gammaproteobacteria bacterium]NIO62560.1 FHA domain-containing protein [Gammaproteobacteria bacterium]NIP49523.1 FHA domain-containing protein [Gammaproteobacteria bacterium]NIQ10747.1 FHA domain-containing protein [Gammaproteobacteria bacterium]
MAKLVLSMNGEVQGEYELSQERMSIGRKAENDIQIDNLAVSGKHALIITILDDSFLEDLGSTNGTYVNGKLVKKHALKDGDVIAIGKHELKYINENATASDDEFEKTMIIKPGSASAAVAAAQAAEKAGAKAENVSLSSTNAPAGMPLARLTVLNGPIAGKELELSKALVTLGKPGTQVAVISRRPQGYFLTHIESDGDGKRYPVVNGEPIGPKAYQLKNSDLIELAGIKMEFTAG